MDIYVIIINDRHTDIEAMTYADKEEAINKARELAKKYCRHPEDYKEHSYDGYLFFVSYSCESDYVAVLKTDLKK